MLIHPRGKDRPYHLGPFPLETLPTDSSVVTRGVIFALNGIRNRTV